MSFWIDDPTVLLNSKYISHLWPDDQHGLNENLNSISRFIILVTIVGYIVLKHTIILVLGLSILGVIVYYKSYKEGYVNNMNDYTSIDSINTISAVNPLGNTLMNDYKNNPHKKDSIPKLAISADKSIGQTPSYETQYDVNIEENINEQAKQFIYENNSDNNEIKNLFANTGDNMVFDQQMRQFNTTPNTTIPNDQSGFLTYCYGTLPCDKSIISH